MMRIKLLILTLLFATGCTFIVPNEIKRNFKYCFDGLNTGLDSLLNIDGYYYLRVNIEKNLAITQPRDTLYPSYIFYSNGFVHVDPWFEYLLDNNKKTYKGRWGDYGRYILVGDTIKIQHVDPPGGMQRSMAEIWFTIIDRNSLRKIYQGSGKDILDGNLPPLHPSLGQKFVYCPFEITISPEETWIMKKKWFHCKNNRQ